MEGGIIKSRKYYRVCVVVVVVKCEREAWASLGEGLFVWRGASKVRVMGSRRVVIGGRSGQWTQERRRQTREERHWG